MSSVRAGLTEPLQQLESLRSIQLLLRDGGKDWLNHINLCVQSSSIVRSSVNSEMDRVPASTTLAAAFGMPHDSPDLKEAIYVRCAFIFLSILACYIAFLHRPSKRQQSWVRLLQASSIYSRSWTGSLAQCHGERGRGHFGNVTMNCTKDLCARPYPEKAPV